MNFSSGDLKVKILLPDAVANILIKFQGILCSMIVKIELSTIEAALFPPRTWLWWGWLWTLWAPDTEQASEEIHTTRDSAGRKWPGPCSENKKSNPLSTVSQSLCVFHQKRVWYVSLFHMSWKTLWNLTNKLTKTERHLLDSIFWSTCKVFYSIVNLDIIHIESSANARSFLPENLCCHVELVICWNGEENRNNWNRINILEENKSSILCLSIKRINY